MSIKIHLEFDSVDEAIVALGKMVGAPVKVAKSAAATGATVHGTAPVASAAPTTARKPRSDAGKPRGPHKQPNAVPQGATGQQTISKEPALPELPAVTAPSTVAPAPVAQAQEAQRADPAPAATVPTQEAVQAAVEKLYNAKGMEVTRDTLARFGVKRAKELPTDQMAAFIAKAEAVAAGKEQP